MTATANDYITAAMGEARLLPDGEPLAAETAVKALGILNRMVSGWAIRSVDSGHSDWALGDDVLIDDRHRDALVANLAVRLADTNGVPISNDLRQRADDNWAALQAAYLPNRSMSFDAGLRPLPRFRERRWF